MHNRTDKTVSNCRSITKLTGNNVVQFFHKEIPVQGRGNNHRSLLRHLDKTNGVSSVFCQQSLNRLFCGSHSGKAIHVLSHHRRTCVKHIKNVGASGRVDFFLMVHNGIRVRNHKADKSGGAENRSQHGKKLVRPAVPVERLSMPVAKCQRKSNRTENFHVAQKIVKGNNQKPKERGRIFKFHYATPPSFSSSTFSRPSIAPFVLSTIPALSPSLNAASWISTGSCFESIEFWANMI